MKLLGSLIWGVVIMMLSAHAAHAETKIRLAGAGGLIPLMTEIAKAYMADNKDVLVEVGQRSIESTGGIMSAAEGKIEIGMSARPLKDDEKGLGLQAVEISRSAQVVGVNRSVGLKEITGEQLCRIYEGRVRSWAELGGGKEAVMALTRPENDATKEAIRKNIPCFKDLKEPGSVVLISTAPEMAKVLANRPNTIGFTDSVAVDNSAGSIMALKVDGVEPNPENIRNGKYKVIKRNFLLTKGPATGPAKDFISFVKGPKGAKIIEAHKAVPVK